MAHNTASGSLGLGNTSILPHPPRNQFIPSNTAIVSASRIRYREQGVDELLQLKLHQAIAAQGDDPPPPGSTIVLATGDGNAGQFNEDGFRGCVRLALRRKWKVRSRLVVSLSSCFFSFSFAPM